MSGSTIIDFIVNLVPDSLSGSAAKTVLAGASTALTLFLLLFGTVRKAARKGEFNIPSQARFILAGMVIGSVATVLGGIPYILIPYDASFPGFALTADQTDWPAWVVKLVRLVFFGMGIGGALCVGFLALILVMVRRKLNRRQVAARIGMLTAVFIGIGAVSAAIAASMSETGERVAQLTMRIPYVGPSSIDTARSWVWIGSGVCRNLSIYNTPVLQDQKKHNAEKNNACDVGPIQPFVVVLSISIYYFFWFGVFLWFTKRSNRGLEESADADTMRSLQRHSILSAALVMATALLNGPVSVHWTQQPIMENPVTLTSYLIVVVAIASHGMLAIRRHVVAYVTTSR